MNNFHTILLENVLDILFPIQCLGCRKKDTWFCNDCLRKIPFTNEHVCGFCEKVTTPFGQTCLACKKHSPLDALLPATSYQQTHVSKAVHLFKYRFIEKLDQFLGILLVNQIRETELPLPDLIIPVPLHKHRLRWRGFNQSALLAKYVSENLLTENILAMEKDVLLRQRWTSPQMEIKDHKERQKNISGAFMVTNKEKIQDKTILLIDDITTTGSTLFECAKVLKAAGAKYVWAAVVARQETKKL